MNVAVGRLQMSITMATPIMEPSIVTEIEERDPLQHAFLSDRNLREVEADKQRWEAHHVLRGRLW
jgi:hypothetical protein